MKNLLTSMLSGFLFGLGLAVSQMMNPVKITDFLDIFGYWDPSLLLVMGGALVVTMLAYPRILKRSTPLYAERLEIPTKTAIDWKLLCGAALFGIGWGLTGYCPGPATAGLAFGRLEPLIMLAAIIAGFLLHRWIFEKTDSNSRRGRT